MNDYVTIVLDLLNANGGEMSYPDIYNSPEVLPFRNRLHAIKQYLKSNGQISVSPLQRNESGELFSTWKAN